MRLQVLTSAAGSLGACQSDDDPLRSAVHHRFEGKGFPRSGSGRRCVGFVTVSDPENPEPELSWSARRAERQRLRSVRRERRRLAVSRAKGRKNRAKGKDDKKSKKRRLSPSLPPRRAVASCPFRESRA